MSPSTPALTGALWALFFASACAAPLPDAAQAPAPWSESGYGPPLAPEKAAPQRQETTRTAPREVSPSSAGRGAPGATPPRLAVAPDGACLDQLAGLGVTFERSKGVAGVETPVVVKGSLGGLAFWANDKRPLLLDCRLALALARLAPVFERYGVTRARFSGAYVRKTTRSGRLSHHAFGLAIDIHSLTMAGETYEVKGGFVRGTGCQGGGSALNQLACELRASGLFEEFLTPDSNRDHADHLHLAVPLKRSRPGSPPSRTAALESSR